MKLDVLGSSGGCPSRGNPASGYLVSAGGTRVWLDAGSGTFNALASIVDPGEVDAVVISHIHVDHCSDLFGFFGYMAYGPSGTLPVKVFMPEGAVDHFAAFLRAGEDHLFRNVFDLITVGDGDGAEVGDVALAFTRTHHPVPTIATRVDDGAASIAYSADTGPGGGFPELAAGASLVLCEATMQGERDVSTYGYHLTAGEAASIALNAGAGRLIMTHLSPTLDAARSVREAAAIYGAPPAVAMTGASFTV